MFLYIQLQNNLVLIILIKTHSFIAQFVYGNTNYQHTILFNFFDCNKSKAIEIDELSVMVIMLDNPIACSFTSRACNKVSSARGKATYFQK